MRALTGLVAALVGATLLLMSTTASAVVLSRRAKCSACQAVAYELSKAVTKEIPQMDIDLRGRLLPSGKRVGKMVDYGMSELRAMEITEGICRNMKDYVRVQGDAGDKFMKISNADGPISITGLMNLGGEDGEAYKRALRVRCDHIIEEYEEEITELIRKAEPGEGVNDADSQLCVKMTSECDEAQLQMDRAEKENAGKDDAGKKSRELGSKEGTKKKTKKRKGKKKKKKKTTKKKRKGKKKGKKPKSATSEAGRAEL